MRPPRSRLILGGLFALGAMLIATGYDPAAGELKKGDPKAAAADPLPPVFAKDQPGSVADLKAIEQRVQELLPKITPAVVGIRIGFAQGSGVIVSKDGYVLTAGHVSGEPGRPATVILPDGRQLKAKTLGRNGGLDSGMIKITDEGEWPYVEMGNSSALKRGQWVLAIGQPGGFRPNRTPVVRVGRVLVANPILIRTDCTLVGGDSGGPLFDMNGKVVGIHSRIGNNITENIHVPVDPYRKTWDRLAKGESWGGQIGQLRVVQSAGGKIVYEKKSALTADDPRDERQKGAFAQTHRFKMLPGFAYTIDMVSPKGKGIDPYLRVENAAGKVVAENDGAGGLNARIVLRPRKEVEYKIVATTFEPDQTGPYELVIRQAEIKLAKLGGTVDVLPAIHLPKQVASQLVEKLGEAGAALYATGTLYDEQGKPATGKGVQFRWDKGQAKVTTDDTGVLRIQLSKRNTKQLYLEVPAGFKVALELTDKEGNPLPSLMSPDFEKAKVKSAGGKLVLQQEGRLGEKDGLDTVRKGCFFQAHTFKMVPGSTYTLDLESPDFDAYLRLEDASGKQLAEDDDGAGKLNSRIVFAPKVEGVYRIVVTTCDPDQTGTYRLSIYQADAKKADRDPRDGRPQ